MNRRTTAREFLTRFIEAYEESIGQLPGDRDKIWDNQWNGLIIGKSTDPPDPLHKSVWHLTAERLGLAYSRGEPLRLDGAFYEDTGRGQVKPFPIRVALEHEYVRANFFEEIVKLLSIRCPLKVGIFYSDKGDRAWNLADTETQIRKYFEEFSALVGEDASAEYLFIAGIVHRHPFHIDWKSLSFAATESIENRHFGVV
jgi:hypothetical protein